MRLTKLLTVVSIVGGLGLILDPSMATAQVSVQQPAELPPADFKGKQYVDSQGCVFIRAGIDGDVSWVPRVTRDRKTVCGFKPSLEAAAPEPVTTVSVQSAAVAPALEPEIMLVVEPAPRPVVVAKPTPAVVRQAAPKPKQRAVKAVAKPAVRMPKPMLVSSVREDGTVAVTSTTRIVPKHVAENRRNTRSVQVPKGYKPVWTDGRLNPRRAEQNLEGRAQMALVWTNTLPRRLINQSNGRDVTTKVPLIYPYTSVERQRQEIGEVEIVRRNGKTVKRVIRTPAARHPVYSSRSAPEGAQQENVVDGGRFVQVGTFRVSENAQRVARQIARMGLPARIGQYRKGGKTYMFVQAGPFAKTDQLNQAVKRVQQAGFGDAFVR